MGCFEITKGRILVLLVSLMIAYAGVIALRGNIKGKNMLLWILLALVLFSFGYCVDGSCQENFSGGDCTSCSGADLMIEGMHGGVGGGDEHHHRVPPKMEEEKPKPADGKHHSTAVPMKLDPSAVKHHKPAHHKKEHQKHKPASHNGGVGGAGKRPTGKLEDNKHKRAVDHNNQLERRGDALPSQSGLMDVDSSPVTININYNSEVDSDNVEKNSNNRKMEVREIMREIGNRQIYPGGGEIVEPCAGDNCIDNRTYNGYCNKGAYQLSQMQREILNLKKKYSQMAYLNDNPYMPMNQEGKRCSVCPLEANGQFASFEGLKNMAKDQPTVNPMMPGVVNRWATRAGNNDPVEDYIPT